MKTRAILLGLACVVAGCGGRAAEFCDEALDCEDLSDKDYDKCLVDASANEDIADAYGCTAEFDEYLDCFLSKYRCRDEEMRLEDNDCDNEGEDLAKCIDDGSSLD
jgi:hypothetical protein